MMNLDEPSTQSFRMMWILFLLKTTIQSIVSLNKAKNKIEIKLANRVFFLMIFLSKLGFGLKERS